MKWVHIVFLKNHKQFLTQIEPGYLMSGFCVSENKLKVVDDDNKNKKCSEMLGEMMRRRVSGRALVFRADHRS